jgi:hypothetical protein
MGILQKNFEVAAKPGETTEFNVLFWNTENFSYPVSLFLQNPERDVYVLILPEKFYLNPENSYENFEYVAKGNDYVKAFPVKILVKTLEGSVGKKEVKIKVLAGEVTNSTISLFQEKTLVFSVDLGKFLKTSEQIVTQEPKAKEIQPEKAVEEKKGYDFSAFLYIFFVALILLISIKIYRG